MLAQSGTVEIPHPLVSVKRDVKNSGSGNPASRRRVRREIGEKRLKWPKDPLDNVRLGTGEVSPTGVTST
jgi:hypothetical protein